MLEYHPPVPELPCTKCGYNLEGLPVLGLSVRCPECGEPNRIDRSRIRQLSLGSWLFALALGATPMVALTLISILSTTGHSNGDFYFVLFIAAMALGSIIAAIFALRAALVIGLPFNRGRWTSRAWVCALLTGMDAFAANLSLAGILIIIASFLAALRF